MDPNGKVAVISGGASGLGAATADTLAEAGATIVVLDLVESAAHPGFVCDITSVDDTERTIDAVIARYGRIDICVNCAGVGGIGPIATPEGPQDLADFRRVIDVNLIGAVNLTRLAAHRMIANEGDGPDGERGVIINAASIASFEGQQGMGAYTASKAAIAALTLVWARDLSVHHIRAMSIAAGFFDTPMTNWLPKPIVENLLETVEFPRRAGNPREFAELALFIVRNPLLNGDVIRLDGGTRPPARSRWTAS
jgi:NAD(P)-dependent dehydrogenase (short-subunit alcohol dehydrogenase family)